MHATLALRGADRARTVGFIGLGAMGSHMVSQAVVPYLLLCLNIRVKKFYNLVTKSSPRTQFAVFDVNDDTVTATIQRHKTHNPNVKVLRCSCKNEGTRDGVMY